MPSCTRQLTNITISSITENVHPRSIERFCLILELLLSLLQGVIVYFRVMDGEMRVGDTVKLINTGKEHQIGELGVLAPKPVQVTP